MWLNTSNDMEIRKILKIYSYTKGEINTSTLNPVKSNPVIR